MRLRSLLFVPGDRPERFAKAAGSGADAIILDLEDSVSLANKDAARHAVADYLAGAREVVTLVRVNPLDGHLTAADVAAIIGYLTGMEEEPSAGFTLGGLGPVTEGLFGWIIGIGGLCLFAVWITSRGARAK